MQNGLRSIRGAWCKHAEGDILRGGLVVRVRPGGRIAGDSQRPCRARGGPAQRCEEPYENSRGVCGTSVTGSKPGSA